MLKTTVTLVLAGLGGLAVGILAFAWLKKVSSQTKAKTGDFVLPSLKFHLPFWFMLLGAMAAAHLSRFSPEQLDILEKTAVILFVFSLSFAVSDYAARLMQFYSGLVSLDVSTASLVKIFVRVGVLCLGGLIVLSSLGIAITPILTALGVSSLAIALALQDTLSNMFSGFYIILNRQIRVGDYIKLESGQEGYVVDVGWRSCRMEELSGNIIIIPNNRLSQAIVTNFHFPDQLVTVPVQLGVSYDSDLDKVEMATVLVAEEVMKDVPGGVPDFKPVVNFHTFGESAIQYTVVLKAKEFADRYAVVHEFIKRLHNRFKKEGITIPYPQQVVHLERRDKST